eukprot:jgi/Botrbrau1/15618/Bobra.4_1s0006.1
MKNLSVLGLLVLVAAISVPSSQGAVTRRLLDTGAPSTAESPLHLMNQNQSNGGSETAVLLSDSGDKMQTMEAPSQDPDPEMQSASARAIGSTEILRHSNVQSPPPPPPNCGAATTDYSYALPYHSRTCEDPSNAKCKPCNLWTNYLATREVRDQCRTHMSVGGHWCERREWVTLVQVLKGQDHYIALPNQAVTGVEHWNTPPVEGAEKFWGDVWAGAERIRKEKTPAWTMENLGVALNPSAHRDQHQMHFHLEALKPEWRKIFNSNDDPTAKTHPTPWKDGQWISFEDGHVLAIFVKSQAGTPSGVSPFQAWENTKDQVKIKISDPKHEVGRLATRDAAGSGWFIALSDGAAEFKFLEKAASAVAAEAMS